jgi:putative transposase
MSYQYTIKDQHALHFVTFTVHQWVDIFSNRPEYSDILLESLRYCQAKKGLKIYAWVIMNNHAHLIVQSVGLPLSDIIRDLKKYTSSKILEAIQSNPRESRKRWLLWLFKKDNGYCFWEEGYHGEEIFSREFCDSKVQYIHRNPVKAGIVEKEEEYLLSSCADFYGVRKGALKLEEF